MLERLATKIWRISAGNLNLRGSPRRPRRLISEAYRSLRGRFAMEVSFDTVIWRDRCGPSESDDAREHYDYLEIVDGLASHSGRRAHCGHVPDECSRTGVGSGGG
jgi:hypothetical protein